MWSGSTLFYVYLERPTHISSYTYAHAYTQPEPRITEASSENEVKNQKWNFLCFKFPPSLREATWYFLCGLHFKNVFDSAVNFFLHYLIILLPLKNWCINRWSLDTRSLVDKYRRWLGNVTWGKKRCIPVSNNKAVQYFCLSFFLWSLRCNNDLLVLWAPGYHHSCSACGWADEPQSLATPTLLLHSSHQSKRLILPA